MLITSILNQNQEVNICLNIYRTIKSTPTTERYLINFKSVGGRRVMAGLRMGCLPLSVETGPYTSAPYQQRGCVECDRGKVEDQAYLLCICPVFQDLRQQLFSHCITLCQTIFTNKR